LGKIIKNIKSYNHKVREEFKDSMSELLHHEKFIQLSRFKQHYKCTRLKHSIDVGYFSFYISKLLGLDYISAGKAALLHDLYFHKKDGSLKDSIRTLRRHPKYALENALEICELNEKECDIIMKHMWFVTVKPPKHIEGFIVTFVDKYCASKEFVSSIFSRSYAYKASRF
jgi:uncharacterized protein